MTTKTDFEASYWGDCTNTFFEEQKQFVYARLMGLSLRGHSIDLKRASVLDVGGGPVSLLLKTYNAGDALKVLDPIEYPAWTRERYQVKGIRVEVGRGEDMHERGWTEAWIYNVLQHVDDPGEILRRAKEAASLIRIFEWIDIPPHEGHPHMLTQEMLDSALGRRGATSFLNEDGCVGRAYYNVVSP